MRKTSRLFGVASWVFVGWLMPAAAQALLKSSGTSVLFKSSGTPDVELSVWAYQSDLGVTPMSLTYNPVSGKLLIAGNSIYEWVKGATSGTLLVPDANWGGSAYACAYIPSRGTYMVTDGANGDIVEVIPGQASQTPSIFVDVDGGNPSIFPAGGMVQYGTYAYYKRQWTGIEQTVRRFTLAGGSGVDSEYVSYAAFQAWSSSGPSQQLARSADGTLYVSARNSVVYANRGIYRWDPGAGALVPVIQEAAIKAYTGQNNTTIYGMTFDALDDLYFYDIYAACILKLDGHGRLSTFLTNQEVRDFMNDPSMQVHPFYMIVVNGELVFISGNASGHVLAARIPLDVEMVTIPCTDIESNGPTYPYPIGKYEITNAQYCVFLNDAELVQQTNPNDPRCTNFWIESATGDVYMEDVTGYSQTERLDRTLYKTSDIPDSKITYDIARAPGSRFYVQAGLEQHPVGTVSWFGAAKFCNWLTINAGLDASQICYHEGTSKHDWYAITASDWVNQGLLDSERLELVRNYRGYRLPMDGLNVGTAGPGVATTWNNLANPYNEWYKAAASDPDAPDTVRAGLGSGEIVPPDHWLFGYGADTYTNADANLANSGDPFPETTPVGWYDGVHLLSDGTPTHDTRNLYGLYDMCGNAAEWINDTALEPPWDSTYRVVRGGHFAQSDRKYATNSVRQITGARYCAENNIGFRVARSAGYGDFDGDGDADLDDYGFFFDCLTGPGGGLAQPACGAADFEGDGDVDLADFAQFQQEWR